MTHDSAAINVRIFCVPFELIQNVGIVTSLSNKECCFIKKRSQERLSVGGDRVRQKGQNYSAVVNNHGRRGGRKGGRNNHSRQS